MLRVERLARWRIEACAEAVQPPHAGLWACFEPAQPRLPGWPGGPAELSWLHVASSGEAKDNHRSMILGAAM
jgi:hypothetical protein